MRCVSFKNNFLIRDYGINKNIKYEGDKRNYLTLFRWGENTFLFALICQFIVFGYGLINKIIFLGKVNINVENILYSGNFAGFLGFTVKFFNPGFM